MSSTYKVILTATGFAVLGGYGIGRWIINLDQSRYNSTFLKSAVAVMKEEQSVIDILGDRISIGKVSPRDGFTKQEANLLQVKLPVAGEKDSAYLFAYARRKTEEEKFKLYKMEMTFNSAAGRKLILMDLGQNTDATYVHPSAEEAKPIDKKEEARQRLMAKMDAEFGPISPRKQWTSSKGKSEESGNNTSP